VFCTPLPREQAEPGKRAVAAGSVVWVDLDGADGNGLREIGRLNPHLWVASGAGQHLYWRLADEVPPAEVEELNRRLCHRVSARPGLLRVRAHHAPTRHLQPAARASGVGSSGPIAPGGRSSQRRSGRPSPTLTRRRRFRATTDQGMGAPWPTTSSS
jgi:hypothetical protein